MAFYRDSVLGITAWFVVSLILGTVLKGDSPWVPVSVFIALSVLWSVWVFHHHRDFLREKWRETRERQQQIERRLGVESGTTVSEAWTEVGKELRRPIDALVKRLPSDAAETQRRRRKAIHQRRQSSRDVASLSEHDRAVERSLPEPRQLPAYLTNWQTQLMLQIQNLDPTAFELLTRDLLLAAGLTDVVVVGGSGDGGIDGIGQLRVLRKAFPVYFQCKRYQGSVGPSEVRDFRGAMDGRTGQGLLITTGTFTKAAREEADRRGGAKPIDLVNGENLMNLMREHRLGLVLDDERERVLRIDHDYFRRLAR